MSLAISRSGGGRRLIVMTTITSPTSAVVERIQALDWNRLSHELDERGFAVTAPILDEHECRKLADAR